MEAAQDSSRKIAKVVFVEDALRAWGCDQIIRHLSVEHLFKEISERIDEPI